MKLTDEQIINALECCKYNDNKTCRYCCFRHDRYCREIMAGNALDLINRQKAEIERLVETNKGLLKDLQTYHDIRIEDIKTAKFEAIKEFEKKFEKKIKDVQFTLGQTWEIQNALKDTSKEMLGECK